MRALLLALLLWTAPAAAGVNRTDIDLKSRICSGDSAPTYDLRKHLGTTAVTATLTNAEFDDLVDAAGTSASAFDAEASSTLGAWYDNLPETTEDPAKHAFYVQFKDIADAD